MKPTTFINHWMIFCILLLCLTCNNRVRDVNVLLEDVLQYNYANHQDSSIYFLTEYLSQETKDTSSIIKAYIALSNTYKGLRNYDKAKNYLLAAEEYIAVENDTLDKDAIHLLVEKALVQFDIQEYADSKETMNRIKPFLYELDSTSRAQFIMQEGYLEFLEGNHDVALDIYGKSIRMMNECAPRHLPMIYAKKMELYASLENLEELYRMRDSSMHYAIKYQLPIYELYTMEVYRDALLNIKEFEAGMEAKEKARLLWNKINYEAKINEIAETEISHKIEVIEKSERDFNILAVLAGLMLFLLAMILYLYTKNIKNKKQIEEQKNELERLNQTKDQIFAILGHDLRKPVVAFRNITQKVNYLLEKEDYSRVKKLGKVIEERSSGLNILTNNLLNWALSEKNALAIHKEELRLNELVYETVQSLSLLANEKHILIVTNIQEKDTVWADSNTLQTILRNLLDNAIKFTTENGQISFGSGKKDGYTFIDVKDTGIGMPDGVIDRIETLGLNPSSPGTKGEKGVGLGLYLVHQLMASNDGKIEITSEKNKGTTFRLLFPNDKI